MRPTPSRLLRLLLMVVALLLLAALPAAASGGYGGDTGGGGNDERSGSWVERDDAHDSAQGGWDTGRGGRTGANWCYETGGTWTCDVGEGDLIPISEVNGNGSSSGGSGDGGGDDGGTDEPCVAMWRSTVHGPEWFGPDGTGEHWWGTRTTYSDRNNCGTGAGRPSNSRSVVCHATGCVRIAADNAWGQIAPHVAAQVPEIETSPPGVRRHVV